MRNQKVVIPSISQVEGQITAYEHSGYKKTIRKDATMSVTFIDKDTRQQKTVFFQKCVMKALREILFHPAINLTQFEVLAEIPPRTLHNVKGAHKKDSTLLNYAPQIVTALDKLGTEIGGWRIRVHDNGGTFIATRDLEHEHETVWNEDETIVLYVLKKQDKRLFDRMEIGEFISTL